MNPESDTERPVDRTIKRLAIELAGVTSELQAAGFDVESPDDLWKGGNKTALPILMKWIPRLDWRNAKNCVMRGLNPKWDLTVEERSQLLQLLLAEYHRAPVNTSPISDIKYSIGETIRQFKDESILDEMVEIIQTPEYLGDRGPFIYAVAGYSRHAERLKPVILELLDDPHARIDGAYAAGRLWYADALPKLVELMDELTDSWQIGQVRTAIRRIENAIEKGKAR